MAVWRTLTLDTMTGVPVAEIVLSGLKFSDVLNDIGSASGTLKLPSLQEPAATDTGDPVELELDTEGGDPLLLEVDGDEVLTDTPTTPTAAARATALVDAVEPNRRDLVIERDGVVVWAGIIRAADYNDDDETIAVTAYSYWTLLRTRYNGTDRTYTATEQLDIARQLVAAAQAMPGGALSIVATTNSSGVVRDRTYEAKDLKSYGELVEELAAVEGGFDFGVDCYWDSNGALAKRLTLSYPQRGRYYDQTGFVFRLGGNITSLKWPNDGTRQANKVWGVGETDSVTNITLIVEAVDVNQVTPAAAGGGGYPALEEVISHTTVSVGDTLQGHVNAELNNSRQPVQLPTATVLAGSSPVLGEYIVGDACRLEIPPGMSPRFPDGRDTYRRIVAMAVSVSDEGTERVDLTFTGVSENPRPIGLVDVIRDMKRQLADLR